MLYQKPGSLRTAEHQGLRSYIEATAEQEKQVLDISIILDAIGRKLQRTCLSSLCGGSGLWRISGVRPMDR